MSIAAFSIWAASIEQPAPAPLPPQQRGQQHHESLLAGRVIRVGEKGTDREFVVRVSPL